MKTIYQRLRWILLTAAVLGGFGLVLSRGEAQSPAMARQLQRGAPKNFHNKHQLTLPIQIDEQSRPQIQKVILFAKEQAGPWHKQAEALPSQREFSFQVARDGEYWFSVVTVDQQGKAYPADVRREPPNLRVIVDTQPPEVELSTMPLNGGQMAVRCTIRDNNPDHSKTQMFVVSGSQNMIPLQRMPGSMDLFQIPAGVPQNSVIRCVATDMAKNPTTKTLPLKGQLASSAPPARQNDPLILASHTQKSPQPVSPPAKADNALPMPKLDPISPMPTPADSPQTVPPQPFPVANKTSGNIPSFPSGKSGTSSQLSDRQLINVTNASIDYRIDKVGPSGVSKVDIWVRGDNTGVWHRLATDNDRQSPAEITLPGEGLYGIRLAVTNGNGFGGNPPRANDEPNFWIEVDTTSPFVQFRPIDSVTKGGTIELRWTATDKNLGNQPVSLFYATKQGGPWFPIAREVENRGVYKWRFPRNSGSQFFVRIEVVDQAGNRSQVETPSPIVLDLTEPVASVVGVTARTPSQE